MYKIDFSPPDKVENKKVFILAFCLSNYKKMLAFFFLCCMSVICASFYIYNYIKIEPTDYKYGDIDFINILTLDKSIGLEFESNTAKSIYSIEYQETFLNNLQKIIFLIDSNTKDMIKEIPKKIKNASTQIIKIDKNNETLLISIQRKSTIKDLPIIINFALHYENNKISKIQSFITNSENIIIKEKFNHSAFDKWIKKDIIIWDKYVYIYEANFNTTSQELR